VFVGRFTALLRALVPSAAGMAKLPYRTFAIWNALGGSVWAAGFVLAGYAAGESYKEVERYLGRGALVLTALVLVVLVVVHFVRRRRATASESSEH
jgi:membrane protein DedA with SNARE-associated domain